MPEPLRCGSFGIENTAGRGFSGSRLSDINKLALRIKHFVHAGFIGQQLQFFLYFCVHELIINFFSKNVNRFASLFVILVRSIFGAAVFTPFFLQLTLCSSCAVRFFAAPIQSTSVPRRGFASLRRHEEQSFSLSSYASTKIDAGGTASFFVFYSV